jgi:peptidoglycan/LPS O-acetylase OafA/YrhL
MGEYMNRLPGLDLLRAIAIVWVMLFHSFVIGGLGERYAWLSDYGWMGVDLFFVLSGYLIGSQLLKPLSQGQSVSFGEFYLRRAFRILPVFLVVLALYFGVPAFRERPGIQPSWQFLTFTVNLLIDYQHNQAFSHAWSLCVEEHFYLLFPWLAWWLTRRPSMVKFLGLCGAFIVLGMAIRGWVWLYDMAPARGLAGAGRSFSQRFVEDLYYPTYTRLDGLLAGVVLATIKAYRPALWSRLQARANVLLLEGIVIVGFAIVLFRDRTGFIPSVFGYPLLSAGLALLVLAGAGTCSWIGTRRVPGAGWISLISYSLYLIHKPVYHMVESTFGTQWRGQGMLAFLAYATASLLAGALLYYVVERPFLRLRERMVLGRSTRAVSHEAAVE